MTRNKGLKHAHLGDSPATDDVNLKMLVLMGQEFGLQLEEIRTIMRSIITNIPKAKEAVMHDSSTALDCFAPMAAGERRWHVKHGRNGSIPHEQKTCRQDFCDRIDGRLEQLFAGMDKYIAILEKKQISKGKGDEFHR